MPAFEKQKGPSHSWSCACWFVNPVECERPNCLSYCKSWHILLWLIKLTQGETLLDTKYKNIAKYYWHYWLQNVYFSDHWPPKNALFILIQSPLSPCSANLTTCVSPVSQWRGAGVTSPGLVLSDSRLTEAGRGGEEEILVSWLCLDPDCQRCLATLVSWCPAVGCMANAGK